MLTIEKLNCEIDRQPILKGIDLQIGKGEVHAIMGPNGSGKSTLSNLLAGHEDYEITDGSVKFNGEDLLEMDVDARALAGMFLAFQYPIALPGVSCTSFLREALNAQNRHRGEPEIDMLAFAKEIRAHAGALNISPEMLKRGVNEGFSGGEKKRFEVLQMRLLQPDLIIMDETDSGLDIDALKLISESINELKNANRSFLIITHYQRLLDYITPDKVHVMAQGKIIKSGDAALAQQLEAEGYQNILADAQC